MATFPLLKAYLLDTLDTLIARHALSGPFLDVGCGRGDIAAHLAARGWSGRAIDGSPEAVAVARPALAAYPDVKVACQTLEEQEVEAFETVVMFDVLEHIADDRGALRAAASLQAPGGALMLVVPTHPAREWRWDDDLYGHVRRYRPEDLTALLTETRYQPVEMWDVTYPVFWLLRRAYTAVKRPPRLASDPWERTTRSHSMEPWRFGIISRLLGHPALQKPVFAVQRRFRESWRHGHEMIVLARRV